MSRFILAILLVWFTVEEAPGAANNLNTRLYKCTAEQVTFQLDIAKESCVSTSNNDFSFVLHSFCYKSNKPKVRKLAWQFLYVNSFERNPFYVLATVNAP
jgi:hypothetical protein